MSGGLCIVDLDGVIFRYDPLYDLCRGSIDLYLYGPAVRDSGLRVISRCLDRGFKIYIVSGRSSRCRDFIEDHLSSAGILFDRLYLRDPMRFSDPVSFKVSTILSLVRGFGFVEVHDDDPDVLRSIRMELHDGRVRLYLHFDDRFREF